MKEQWKLIIGIILLILVVVFALQNTGAVELDLFFVSFNVPLVLIILFSLLIGVIIGLIATATSASSNRHDNKRLTKELDRSKEEYNNELRERDRTISELRDQVNTLERKQTNTATFSDNFESETPTAQNTAPISDDRVAGNSVPTQNKMDKQVTEDTKYIND